jgi:hypothetical protein
MVQPIRRQTAHDHRLLDIFNGRFAETNGDSTLQAMAVVPSQVHPHDGFAVQFNVRSSENNDVLHVHSNGSHAMALFHEPDANQTTLRRRQGYLDTQDRYYEFSGLGGECC